MKPDIYHLNDLFTLSLGLVQVLDLKTLIDFKKASKNPGKKQRLMVLEETLRHMNEEQ